MKISLRTALFALSSTVVIACSSPASETSPDKSSETGGSSPSAGDSKGSQSGSTNKPGGETPGPSGSTPSPSGGSCPKVEGTFAGPAEGLAALVGDELTDPVVGDGKVVVEGEKIPSGTFDVTIKTAIDVRVAMEIGGVVKCGKLDAKLSGQAVGQGIHGTATCTMTETGCKGEWQALKDSDDKLVAKGTFTVAKKK